MTNDIVEGMTVYDAAGEKVGTVREYNTQSGYVDVEKGWLFHKDFYIPLNTVTRSDQDGVYLNVYKDDLSGDMYSQPPVGGTTTGAYDTMAQTGAYDTTAQTGAYDTTAQTAAYDTTARTTQQTGQTTNTNDIRVPVYEEELVVGKREQEEGRVHLHKEVTSEQETIPVTLRREEVTVERVPVDQNNMDPNAVTDAFKNADIDVPVMGEEAVVGKQVREVEEVRLHKNATTEQQQ
nr:PRC and DUF2382 domain-containing protein [Chloroflexota bacterium]